LNSNLLEARKLILKILDDSLTVKIKNGKGYISNVTVLSGKGLKFGEITSMMDSIKIERVFMYNFLPRGKLKFPPWLITFLLCDKN
jgi:hypothetical protein